MFCLRLWGGLPYSPVRARGPPLPSERQTPCGPGARDGGRLEKKRGPRPRVTGNERNGPAVAASLAGFTQRLPAAQLPLPPYSRAGAVRPSSRARPRPPHTRGAAGTTRRARVRGPGSAGLCPVALDRPPAGNNRRRATQQPAWGLNEWNHRKWKKLLCERGASAAGNT